MRRADRLFRLVDLLRHRRAVTTAAHLAEALGTSTRTVYRDVRDLIASGVPIEGEAGVGYRLRGYDLPPVTFTQDEIEALVLGGRIVDSWGDPELARAARAALVKIEVALPASRKPAFENTALFAPPTHSQADIGIDMAELRRAVREKRKVRLRYTDGHGAHSDRVIYPLGVAFFGPIWMVPAWCELRQDFRVFRPDRVQQLEVLEDGFETQQGQSIQDYMATLAQETPRGRC